jgi:hypothetical protein
VTSLRRSSDIVETFESLSVFRLSVNVTGRLWVNGRQ